VIVGTRSFENEIRGNHGLPRPLVILPGAVVPTACHPAPPEERRAARATFGIPRDATVVLYHGRIDWRKGVGDLLEAFAKVRRAGPASLQLVLSGVGPDEERMHQAIEDLGLREQCRYLGYVPYAEAPTVYAVGDIFCTPTYGEGFSNTIVEAMASALPVLSTRVTGVEDVIDDAVTGLMVKAQAPDELAGAMRRLLGDADLQRTLARNGRQVVEQRYAWSDLAVRLTRLYDEVRARPRSHAWTFELPAGVSVDACRYRAAPHLL
jgi:glycosyltransferase involved in cell wall biosynthesis